MRTGVAIQTSNYDWDNVIASTSKTFLKLRWSRPRPTSIYGFGKMIGRYLAFSKSDLEYVVANGEKKKTPGRPRKIES